MNKNNRLVGSYFSRYSNTAVTPTQTETHQYNGGGVGSYTVNASSTDPMMGNVVVETLPLFIDKVSSTQSPSGPNPQKGAVSFPVGTKVMITAVANRGYRFVSWNGDFPNGKRQQNPIYVTMNKNIVISANFTKIENYGGNTTFHGATISWNGTMGRVYGNGMEYLDRSSAGESGKISAEAGSSVTIEARPNSGYHFVKWHGAPIDGKTDPSRTFQMNNDYNIYAEFAADDGGENPGDGGENPGGGGENPGGGGLLDPPVVPEGTGTVGTIVAYAKKYWWVLAIAVAWYLHKKGKLW